MPVPTTVRVRMFQVGFGDCLLVSFLYGEDLPDGGRERHLLFDCGNKQNMNLAPVARQIATACNGHLEAIVVTHRHQDHLSGFGQAAAAQALDALHPKLIIRPWTERPDAPETGQGIAAGDELGEHSRRFIKQLDDMQRYAAALASAAGGATGLRGNLGELAFGPLKNPDAIKQLDTWARPANQGAYVKYGDALATETLFPGVSFKVIGPPTLEQHAGADQEGPESEYWLWKSPLLSAAGATNGQPFRPRVPAAARGGARRLEGQIGPERWLIEQMEGQQLNSLYRVVRIMDDVLNNTSVILLIQAGEKRLLFPGDAEVMNWDYVLNDATAAGSAAIKHDLAKLDLYKVGHHGSRNATPKSLWKLWTEQSGAQPPSVALMSTKVGVYPTGENPHTKPATAVPRIPLVNALAEKTALYATGELSAEYGYVQTYTHVPDGVTLEAKTDAGAAFVRVPNV